MLKKKSKITTVDTLHSHITKGMEGTVIGILEDGYEVYYPKALKFDVFYKGTLTTPATVFMRFGDVEPIKPKRKGKANKKTSNGSKPH